MILRFSILPSFHFNPPLKLIQDSKIIMNAGSGAVLRGHVKKQCHCVTKSNAVQLLCTLSYTDVLEYICCSKLWTKLTLWIILVLFQVSVQESPLKSLLQYYNQKHDLNPAETMWHLLFISIIIPIYVRVWYFIGLCIAYEPYVILFCATYYELCNFL